MQLLHRPFIIYRLGVTLASRLITLFPTLFPPALNTWNSQPTQSFLSRLLHSVRLAPASLPSPAFISHRASVDLTCAETSGELNTLHLSSHSPLCSGQHRTQAHHLRVSVFSHCPLPPPAPRLRSSVSSLRDEPVSWALFYPQHLLQCLAHAMCCNQDQINEWTHWNLLPISSLLPPSQPFSPSFAVNHSTSIPCWL